MVGILVSFWDGLFSGAMLVSGRVCQMTSFLFVSCVFFGITHKDGKESLHFKQIIGTPKWMVKIMVPNPMNKWDDLGYFHPYFWFNTHLFSERWCPDYLKESSETSKDEFCSERIVLKIEPHRKSLRCPQPTSIQLGGFWCYGVLSLTIHS